MDITNLISNLNSLDERLITGRLADLKNKLLTRLIKEPMFIRTNPDTTFFVQHEMIQNDLIGWGIINRLDELNQNDITFSFEVNDEKLKISAFACISNKYLLDFKHK